MLERNIYQLLLACPQLGTWPTTQACALIGNGTSDLSVCRPVLNPLITPARAEPFFLITKYFPTSLSVIATPQNSPCNNYTHSNRAPLISDCSLAVHSSSSPCSFFSFSFSSSSSFFFPPPCSTPLHSSFFF
ncbi:hypothetical protein HJG60_012098 [Phyllostomus discolor]|uniref:Uncharacterized protein n=1 Tax=Phyllostomus discolor TaxID=89673 RepID=A0A833ZQ65_9CHIR|nr:hypothetical protein HJG60_012098 [Phyllostomus discolor]